MRLTEAEYQAYLRRGQPAPISEAAFQSAVVRIAARHGYTLAYHTYRSTRSPSGFPDLILCHERAGHPCWAIEVKTDTGQVTLAQHAWLDALQGSTHLEAEVLRPAGLEAFVARLRET